MSREYTGHRGRVAAAVTHLSAGWDPPEPEVFQTRVRRCPRRWDLPSPRCRGVPATGTSQARGAEVSRPPARTSGTGGSPGWVRAPGPAPAGLREPRPRAGAAALCAGQSGARERRPRGRDAGPRGGAMGRCDGEVRSAGSCPGRAAPAEAGRPPLRSPRSEVSVGAGRAPGAARGGRRGGAAGGSAVPPRRGAVPPAAPTFQHRAEFVQGHCLPAAAAISGAPWPRRCPPRGRCARGYGSAPARPRPCPAPPRGALSLRRPSAEPPPRSVPWRAGRGGLRRGWPAPGGSTRGARSAARQLPARLKRLLLNEAHLRCEGCLPG